VVPPPLVSVVMPVFNARSTVLDAVGDVLAQSHRALELVVVDDGSSDGSAELARRVAPGAEVVSQANAGEAAARSRGVEIATGSHLAFLDADDIWVAEKLRLQLDAMRADPAAELVFGHSRLFRSGELDARHQFAGDGEVRPAPNWQTLLMRRETLEEVGPFSTEWKLGSFLEWLSRARQGGHRELMLPEVLLLRRLHPYSLTAGAGDDRADYARALKRALDQRRAG
jgi:glycosyltransferase involved in cell wall biosynthesis